MPTIPQFPPIYPSLGTPAAQDLLGYWSVSGAQTRETSIGSVLALAGGGGATPVTQSYLSQFKSSGVGVDPTGVIPSQTVVQAWINSLAGGAAEGIWDCPVYCQMGQLNQNTIFISSNTYVRFTSQGVCITDGIGVTTFLIACGINDVYFTNFTMKYIPSTGGSYGNLGAPVAGGGPVLTAASNFANITLLNYLQAAYVPGVSGVSFSSGGTPIWSGPTNASAIFRLKGNCNRIKFLGKTRAYAPPNATADQFIPVFMALDPEWLPGSAVTSGTPQTIGVTMQYPASVEFESVELDGFLMGFVGAPQYFLAKHSHFMRYSDLQANLSTDPTGAFIGGNGNWFAPPHAFYLYAAGAKITSHLSNLLDDGTYVGIVTRRSGSSGIMHSIKLEPANFSSVTNARIFRPDGAIQVLSQGAANGKIEGLFAIVDTRVGYAVNSGALPFTPTGLLFPSAQPLIGCFISARVIDIAPVPTGFPVGSDSQSAHQNLIFNVETIVQDWPLTAYIGTSLSGNNSTSAYNVGYPGFGFGGNGVQVDHRLTMVACTATQTFRGTLANQGAVALINSTFYVTVTGWRAITTNLDNLKQRILAGAGGTNTGNRLRVIDSTNGWEADVSNNREIESYTQSGVFNTTATANISTGFLFPSQMSITEAAWDVLTTLTGTGGSLTGTELGWTGTAGAIVTGLNVNTTQNGIPYFSPVSLGGSNQTVLVTPTGGATAFATGGVFWVSVTGKRMSLVG